MLPVTIALSILGAMALAWLALQRYRSSVSVAGKIGLGIAYGSLVGILAGWGAALLLLLIWFLAAGGLQAGLISVPGVIMAIYVSLGLLGLTIGALAGLGLARKGLEQLENNKGGKTR